MEPRTEKINAYVDKTTKGKLIKLAQRTSMAQVLTDLINNADKQKTGNSLEDKLKTIETKLDIIMTLLVKKTQ